jgi:hypothetical protein
LPDAELGEQLSLEEPKTNALAGQTSNGSNGTRTRGSSLFVAAGEEDWSDLV